MNEISDEQGQMDLFLAVSKVVATAMSNYATAVTGRKCSTAPFEFEADSIVAEIMRAGYQIVRNPPHVRTTG